MTDSDHEPELPRLADSGSAEERRLLRSARLDVPEPSARERMRHALLAARPAARRRVSRARWLGAGVALGAAALALMLLRGRPPTTPLRAELPRERSAAPSAPPAAPPLPPCPKLVVANGGDLWIDDMEDRNARILVEDGRSGTWRMSGDPQAKQTPKAGELVFPVPIPGARGKSRYALHVFGGQLSGSGAGFSADFAPGHCYDASRFAGVEFWGKGPGRVRVAFTMIDVMSEQWGGLCKENCYDGHQKPVDLGRSWQLYQVRFDELEQMGWGGKLAFDAHRLLSLDFRIEAADTPFDLWIDDVRFIER